MCRQGVPVGFYNDIKGISHGQEVLEHHDLVDDGKGDKEMNKK